MLDADHRFRRTSTENERDIAKAEENKVTEHGDKVRQFQWDDDIEETEGKPLMVSDEEIEECSSVLAAHLLAHITGEYFIGTDAEGAKFVIPVDLDLHILLQKRFEEEWDLDSRLDMFDLIRRALLVIFSGCDEKKQELDIKIQEALPSSRKKFISGVISLEDDAMVVDDESNMVSIEISLSFAANL